MDGARLVAVYLLLVLNAVALAAGQIFFKATAVRIRHLPFPDVLWGLACVPAFYAACLLYAAATVLWVVILTKVPLSAAYPFVALSFPLVVLISWLFLGESPTKGTWAGVLVVATGVGIIAASLRPD